MSPRSAARRFLVHLDPENIVPGHRQRSYRSHIAQLELEKNAWVYVMSSSTSMESFTPVYLIDFFLRIQLPIVGRTHFNGDNHSLTIKRMSMNQASHSHRHPSVSILYQTESEVVGRALAPVAHESLMVCLILNYVNMNSALSHFTVDSSRFLESLSLRNYLPV